MRQSKLTVTLSPPLPRIGLGNDYWQLHMRGEKEMLTFNYYRTTAKLVRNDGTVEEVPILITENITGGKEHRAYIDMNRRLERMDRIYNEPAPR